MRERQIINLLLQFGFTDEQARLFFAGLNLGPSLMMNLAKHAKIPRSTAYYIMKELLRRKFFHTKKIGQRTYYVGSTLYDLLKMAKHREQLVKKLIALLKK